MSELSTSEGKDMVISEAEGLGGEVEAAVTEEVIIDKPAITGQVVEGLPERYSQT